MQAHETSRVSGREQTAVADRAMLYNISNLTLSCRVHDKLTVARTFIKRILGPFKLIAVRGSVSRRFAGVLFQRPLLYVFSDTRPKGWIGLMLAQDPSAQGTFAVSWYRFGAFA